MNDLSLALLGTYQVWRDDRPITQFHSNNVRALLAYLVIEGDRAHERILLAALLWPDEPSEAGLTNLRQTLHRLGQSLGAARARGKPPDSGDAPALLLATRQAVQLNPAAVVQSDVRQFTQLIASVEGHPHRRLSACRACMERLRAAVALYRGDFLAGFAPEDGLGFEEWLLRWRERLRGRAVWALATLAEHYAQRGEHASAAEYGRRCVELEPWREEAHQGVMRALALSGQRSAALAQYERCRTALEAELSAEPLPETIALASAIRAGRAIAAATPLFNVPHAPNQCIGRATELATIAAHLAGNDCRLLTLVGPGGVGKTRLALEAAAAERGAFADGVVFVPLAALPSAEHLAAALVNRLGLAADATDHTAPRAALHSYLRRRELLLILDNFEHILDGAELLAKLLEAAPELRVLVTSREPLHLYAEWVLRVDGLALPPAPLSTIGLPELDAPDDATAKHLPPVTDAPAVQLFVHTAQRADPTFTPDATTAPIIAQICTLLAGLPLAISLASGLLPRVAALDVLAMLQHDLAALHTIRRDETERHRSLAALFQSAWRLLLPAEQQVLAHCAVFSADFSAAAALALLDDASAAAPSFAWITGTLDTLADKSLLQRSEHGRYALHAVVQQFALAQLVACGAEAQARARHSAFFLALLTRDASALVGRQARPVIARLRAELTELRAAWGCAVAQSNGAALAEAAPALCDFARMIGVAPAGVTALDAALTALRAAGNADSAAHIIAVLLAQAELLYTSSDYAALVSVAEEAHTRARARNAPLWEAAALLGLGKARWRQGQGAEAAALLQQARARMRAATSQATRVSQRTRGQIHYYQGLLAWSQGQFERARSHYQAALRLAQAADDGYGEGDARNNLALVAFVRGALAEAVQYSADALAVYRSSGNRAGEGLAQLSLGMTHMHQRQERAAQHALAAGLRIHERAGDRQNTSVMQLLSGMLATRRGDYRAARQALDQGLATSRTLNHQWGVSIGLAYDGLLRHLTGDHAGAEASCRAALVITAQTHDPVISAYALTHLGHALLARAAVDEARAIYQQAYALRCALGQRHLAPEPLAGLARCAMQRGQRTEALAHVAALLTLDDAAWFSATEEPARIVLTCADVLAAYDDGRAATLLAAGAAHLRGCAAQMPNPDAEQRFLTGVSANRTLLARAGAQPILAGAPRALLDPRMAHPHPPAWECSVVA